MFIFLNLASGRLLRGCGTYPPEMSVRAIVAFAMLVEIVYAQAALALSCEGSFMHPVDWKTYVSKRRALRDAAMAQELFEINGVNAIPAGFLLHRIAWS